MTTIQSHEDPRDGHAEQTMVQVAKVIIIAAETTSIVYVLASKRGFMAMKRVQLTKPTNQIFATGGIHKDSTNIPV